MQKEAFSSCSCGGKHPFRPNAKIAKCTKPVIPSQRGASNVYFSVVRSAISIPPWVNPLYSLIEEHQKDLDLLKKVLGEDKAYDALYEQFFKEKYSRKEFDDALKNSKPDVKEYTQIKQMEYDAITHHSDPAYASNPQHFKAEEDPLPRVAEPHSLPENRPDKKETPAKIAIDNSGKSTYSVINERPANLSDQENAVLDLLGPEPQLIDSILDAASLPSGTVQSILTRLAIRGLVKYHPDGRISKNMI